jgi:hypothetical protein
MKPRTLALLILAGVAQLSGPARAQQAKPISPVRGPFVSGSLLDRVGIGHLERTLRGGGASERERALSRLGSLGSARALELLVRALDPSGAAQSPRERLIVVRALAAHAKEPAVRECLVRVMTGISASAERGEPLHALLRDTAALALSASGDPPALEALGKALRQSGRVAQAAAAAIAAHPPSELSALVRAHYAPTIDLVAALEALGDERAFELLRDVVRRGSPELRARAALALTRLGNFETVELSLRWAETPSQPTLRLAAAEILLLARDQRGEALLAALLGAESTRAQALALAEKSGRPALEAPLLAAFAKRDPSETSSLLAALGQSGGAQALALLEKLSCDPALGDAAAYALSTSPAAEASAALSRLFARPECQRRAARAATLRAAASAEVPRGLLPLLERLLASSEPKDRAVGALGLSLLRPEQAPTLLASKDPLIVQAAARAAPFVGAALPAAHRLETEPAGPTRSQLALALVDAGARATVPTQVLLELTAEAGAATPLALFALAERDSEAIRARLLGFMSSDDPLLRASVARGLGESREPSALGVLENSYRFEPDGRVRRAIVQAVARRKEPARLRLLELAATLDPEPDARQVAELGLSGIRAASFVPAHGTLWLSLAGGTQDAVPAASVELPGGLAVPILTDPDGVAALARLPAGMVVPRFTLEPRPRQKPLTP